MRSARRFRGFNKHPKLEGSHAFLSPSNYHWLNYTQEKLLERLRTTEAAARGTSLHELAAHAIREGILFDENQENAMLALYVNDAIRLGLVPEQTLFYSLNCYGTADTMGFEEYPEGSEFAGFLRINDYKSGVAPTSEKQLYIYAGIFCLEYGFRPYDIEGELSIYQEPEVRVYVIDRNYLAHVYDTIRSSNAFIEEGRMEGPL